MRPSPSGRRSGSEPLHPVSSNSTGTLIIRGWFVRTLKITFILFYSAAPQLSLLQLKLLYEPIKLYFLQLQHLREDEWTRAKKPDKPNSTSFILPGSLRAVHHSNSTVMTDPGQAVTRGWERDWMDPTPSTWYAQRIWKGGLVKSHSRTLFLIRNEGIDTNLLLQIPQEQPQMASCCPRVWDLVSLPPP